MTTPLRTGAPVHGGILTEHGGWLGSQCRYVGVLHATLTKPTPRRYVLLTDGSIRRFTDDQLHHADDCPNKAAMKGWRR